MNDVPKFLNQLQDRMAGLTDRERKLVLLMLVTGLFMALALGNMLIGNTLRDTRAGNAERRAALELLIAERETYLQQTARVQDLDDRLRNNQVRLSSFIETRSERAGVPRPTEFRDHQQPLAGFEGITSVETTVTYPSMSFEQLMGLLDTIESSNELVFIQTLKVQPARRGQAGLDAELTLVTYRSGRGN